MKQSKSPICRLVTRLQENFAVKMQELNDLKEVINIALQNKYDLLENLKMEQNFKLSSNKDRGKKDKMQGMMEK